MVLACRADTSRRPAAQSAAAVPPAQVSVPVPSDSVPTSGPAAEFPELYHLEDIPDAAVPACRFSDRPLTPDSAGPIRLGLPRDSLLERCPTIGFSWYWTEGEDAVPAFAFRMGRAIYLAVLTGLGPAATVQAIASATPDVPAVQGLRVGLPYDSLAAILGPPRFYSEGCGVQVEFAAAPHYVFELAIPAIEPPSCGLPEGRSPPAGSSVHAIWIRR